MAHGFLQSFSSDIDVFSAGNKPAENVNPKAVEVMKEVGIDISDHIPHNVSEYINEPWDYVITVCGGSKESCPVFVGNVGKRLHIGFDDPSNTIGSDEFVMAEFRRVRDEIKTQFSDFYIRNIKNR
jgi:hypothetical protein